MAEADDALLHLLQTPGQGQVERVAILDIIAIDWSSPQTIPQLVSLETARHFADARVKHLEAENERLQQALLKYEA